MCSFDLAASAASNRPACLALLLWCLVPGLQAHSPPGQRQTLAAASQGPASLDVPTRPPSSALALPAPEEDNATAKGGIPWNFDLLLRQAKRDVFHKETTLDSWDRILFGTVLAAFTFAHYLVASVLEPSIKLHCLVLGLWLLCAAAVNVEVWSRHGFDAGRMWLAGYILEWMLSLDNLFVFHLVFTNFRTPPVEREKALFIGILGAVALRVACFVVSFSFLDYFVAARYIFGAVLIYSGIKGAFFEEGDENFQDSYTMSVLNGSCGSRFTAEYSKGRLFFWGEDGRLRATLLVPLICVLEVTDLLFAFDSVAAKMGTINDEAIALTSTVVAMFGLRSLFFIIEYLMTYFELLQYGVGFILVFIGAEMLLHPFLEFTSTTTLCVIMSVFFLSIGASLLLPKAKEQASGDVAANVA